jgi:hypothetical protein
MLLTILIERTLFSKAYFPFTNQTIFRILCNAKIHHRIHMNICLEPEDFSPLSSSLFSFNNFNIISHPRLGLQCSFMS